MSAEGGRVSGSQLRLAAAARELALQPLLDYQREAMTSSIYPRVWSDHHNTFIPVYPAMAMLGEIGELCEKITTGDRVGVAKEAGDVLWYVAAAARDFGLTFDDLYGTINYEVSSLQRVNSMVLSLVAAAGEFAEQNVKKPWRDRSPLDDRSARAPACRS